MCTFNWRFGPLPLSLMKTGHPQAEMSLSWSKWSLDKKVGMKDLVLIGPSGVSLQKLSYIFF